jgi:hypothetical protein
MSLQALLTFDKSAASSSKLSFLRATLFLVVIPFLLRERLSGQQFFTPFKDGMATSIL